MDLRCNYCDRSEDIIIEIANCIDMNTAIVCIGTDRFTGDCLGPLVGTLLKEKSIKLDVYGTLDEPIHGQNLNYKLAAIKERYKENIIAIDACVGPSSKLNEIIFEHKPLTPGKGVGKNLGEIGNKRFVYVVNISDEYSLFNIKEARLNKVYTAAKNMAAMILEAYELVKEIETVQLVACD